MILLLQLALKRTDDALARFCASAGYRVFRGSLNDVLDRFVKAIGEYECDHVVRLTADCPDRPKNN